LTANSSPPVSHFSLLTSSLWLAARFLFPCDDRRLADDPSWRAAGHGLALWGVFIGVTYAVVFGVSWRWFGEYQYIRWMPAVAVLTVDLGFGGYRLLAGAANVASRRYTCAVQATPLVNLPGLIAILIVAIAKYAMILSLPLGQLESSAASAWDHSSVGGWVGLLHPAAIYRPLILMPVWGRWAMVLALSIGRVAPGGSARLEHMARAARLAVTLVLWLLVTALTVWYCSHSYAQVPQGLGISLGVLTVSYLAGFVLVRRAGGQTEATVACVGLAGELAFLAFYLPMARSIYWY